MREEYLLFPISSMFCATRNTGASRITSILEGRVLQGLDFTRRDECPERVDLGRSSSCRPGASEPCRPAGNWGAGQDLIVGNGT